MNRDSEPFEFRPMAEEKPTDEPRFRTAEFRPVAEGKPTVEPCFAAAGGGPRKGNPCGAARISGATLYYTLFSLKIKRGSLLIWRKRGLRRYGDPSSGAFRQASRRRGTALPPGGGFFQKKSRVRL